MFDETSQRMRTYTQKIDAGGPAPVLPRIAIIGPIAANVAFVMELTIVPLLLSAIQSQFSLSMGDLVWVFNTYGIAVTVGVLLGGWCGDAFNTRKVFTYGVAFFAAGSLLVAAAGSFETLIVGRALQGLGGGIFSPLVPLLLTRASSQRPGRVLIVWGSIAGYVTAFTPFLFSSVLGAYGWNLAFVLIAVLAIIALVILNRTQVCDAAATGSHPEMNYLKVFQTRELWMIFVYVFCTYGSITYYLFQLPVSLSNNDFQVVSVGLTLTIM